MIEPEIIDWLLEGDPSICWQVHRDLLGSDPSLVSAERERVALEGWGRRLLERQDPPGTWGGGLYTPKWISTTYTLLTLRFLGLPTGNPQALKGCELLLERGLYRDGGINFWRSFKHSETCVTGMVLSILVHFGIPDPRVHILAEHLLRQQMPDGGWNCETYKGATHSSFHTTISVLEGLLEYEAVFPERASGVREAQRGGREFLLKHRLYRSHRTGEVVDPAMTRFPFPPRWHYDALRGLDYFRSCGAERDERMGDAIRLLEKKRMKDGRWPAYQGPKGRIFFEMEKAGEAGRGNTLRALRVLDWWNGD
jgi:hypothetical protein